MLIYTVKAGDTLFRLSQTYGVSVDTLVRDNQLEYPDRLVIGQALVIENGRASGGNLRMPDSCGMYTVNIGDTFFTIAETLEMPLEILLGLNPSIKKLRPGQTLCVPGAAPEGKPILVNGYCYPHITTEVLNTTAPFLTFASIFSYEVRRNGSLQPISDTALIERITSRQVAPLMVITNIDESGSFSSELAAAILRDTAVQAVLIENIRTILQEKGYRGLDVDFEYVYGADRENYNAFLERLRCMLQPLGLTLSSAVPAKTRVDQPGILYEGVDYAAHGRICDFVLLMTYDWGYKYGPPMAVSPFYRMEEVVRFAITQIPNEKVLLGMPNYGYDWPLPFVQGNAATLVRNAGAVSLAINTRSQIFFDEASKTPYFEYRANDGRQHIVWFDDARSFDAKLSLVAQYELGGIGYWNINTLFMQGWLVLRNKYAIRHMPY